MRKFSRSFAAVALAAVAVTGPAVVAAAPASADTPTARTVTTAAAGTAASAGAAEQPSTLSGGFKTDLRKLGMKAEQHQDAADRYERLRKTEAGKKHPSKKKLAYYKKKRDAHRQKAAAYQKRIKELQDAERRG